MRRFSIVTVFQLGFLLFCTARTRIFKSHPLFHEPWKNEFDLDLILLVALGCFVDFITDLDVHAKREEGSSKHGNLGSKSQASTYLPNYVGCH